jgi:flagellar M-ring protein FliF
MTLNQQLILGGVFALVVGLIFFASRLGGTTSMTILYSGLEPDAAAGVVDELESQGIDYELTDNGRVVWVPRDRASSIRLDMGAAGLPAGTDGWSVLDSQGITASEFDQRVGYQRAMEGELASTITVIDGVAAANVHLVLPEQDLFVGDEIKPSASVLLQTEPGRSIAPGQVQAIVNLVASSVEGLDVSDVTVTDDEGRLLAGGDGEGLASMETDNQIRLREAFERDIESELGTLLDAVVGPGRAVVAVSADLDFDTVVTTEETHAESQNAAGETLPLSETTRLEEYGNLGRTEEGVVDIETEILEGPAETATDGAVSYRLDERDVIYALDSVVTSTEKAPGSVRSLSVAVVIDEAVVPVDRLAEIESSVSAAIGADPERGDIVTVAALPFDVTLEEQEAVEAAAAEAAGTVTDVAGGAPLDLIRTAGSIGIGLIVLLLGLFTLRRASRRRVIDTIDLEQLASGATSAELGPGDTTEVASLPATEEDLLELVSNQPDDVAAVLRHWLTQPEGVR